MIELTRTSTGMILGNYATYVEYRAGYDSKFFDIQVGLFFFFFFFFFCCGVWGIDFHENQLIRLIIIISLEGMGKTEPQEGKLGNDSITLPSSTGWANWTSQLIFCP